MVGPTNLKPRDDRSFDICADKGVEAGTLAVDPEFPEHSTGQVFDIDRSNLPRGERECLNFTLDD